MGIVAVPHALEVARKASLDLVEVAPTASPPVCRVMDYNKYKYEQSKKEKEARKKQHIIHTKEIVMRPHIDEHDYQVKLAHMIDFLKRGDRVKVTVMFRGRELMHKEKGKAILERVQNDISEVGQAEKPPTSEARNIVVTLIPKH